MKESVDLKRLADLMHRGLDYTPWLSREGWIEAVKPLTRPFLESVRDELAKSLKISKDRFTFAAPGSAQRKRSTFDSLSLSVTKELKLSVRVGEEVREKEWDERLNWGVTAWGGEDLAQRLNALFEKLSWDRRSDYTGILHSDFFGGASFVAVNSMSSYELEKLDSEELVSRIVNDLADWYDVIKARQREIESLFPPPEDLTEIQRFFTSQGLHFTSEQLATFYTALKTKGFVILTGISGTGKTKLAQYFAELLGSKDQFHFAAVCPDWRDSKSLLGYFNPLLGEQGQFQSTDFLGFILRAKAEYDQRGEDAHPYFVLLDEMNLAKVEYYFADFLSVLESGRDDDGFTKEAIRFQYPAGIDGPPRQFRLPPNLYFIGTVNVDETTYMFSPKVLDRAFTLELGTVNLQGYPGEQGEPLSDEALEQLRAQFLPDFTRQGQFAVVDKTLVAEFAATHDIYRQHLSTLNTLLQPHDLHFGYRVFDEIMMFLANAEGSPIFEGFGPDELDAAFDAAVLMKVLPKFHGTRGKLRSPLEKIVEWAREPGNPQVGQQALSGKLQDTEGITGLKEDLRKHIEGGTAGENSVATAFAYPRMALKALRMLHDLDTTGFASFA
jgi:energy-coupling factor transporter ATP-binding protein EcfA2